MPPSRRAPPWARPCSSCNASTGERKYVRSLVVAGAGWDRTVTGSVPGHMTGRRVVPGGDRRPPESCVFRGPVLAGVGRRDAAVDVEDVARRLARAALGGEVQDGLGDVGRV